jgi:transcriptional regulator with XRE-family HTH domain
MSSGDNDDERILASFMLDRLNGLAVQMKGGVFAFAKVIGIDRGHFYRLLRTNKAPSVMVLIRAAKHFNLPIDYFFSPEISVVKLPSFLKAKKKICLLSDIEGIAPLTQQITTEVHGLSAVDKAALLKVLRDHEKRRLAISLARFDVHKARDT